MLYLGTLLRSCTTTVEAREHARSLRFSKAECDLLASIVESTDLPQHDYLQGNITNGRSIPASNALPASAIHTFFLEQSRTGVEVCLLSLAEILASHGPELPQLEWAEKVDVVVALLDGFFNRYREVIEPPKLVDGSELMRALGIHPGEHIGALLAAISAAQAAGDITTREQAIDLAGKLHTDPDNA